MLARNSVLQSVAKCCKVLQKCCIALFTPIPGLNVNSLFIFLLHWYRLYRLYKEIGEYLPFRDKFSPKVFQCCKVLQSVAKVLQKCCIALFTPIPGLNVNSLFIFLSHWYPQYRLYKEKGEYLPFRGKFSPKVFQCCKSVANVLQSVAKVLHCSFHSDFGVRCSSICGSLLHWFLCYRWCEKKPEKESFIYLFSPSKPQLALSVLHFVAFCCICCIFPRARSPLTLGQNFYFFFHCSLRSLV